jgi:hypothetical protein
VRTIPFVAIIAAAAYFFVLADRLEFDSAAGRLGPDAWPKALLALMIAVAGLGALKAAFAKRPDEGGGAEIESLGFEFQATEKVVEAPSPMWLHLPILGSLLFLGYVMVLDAVGFVVATAALFAAFLYLGRYRNHLVIGILSVVGTLAFFYVFRTVAYISLPLGKGPFLTFSVFLMKVMGMT